MPYFTTNALQRIKVLNCYKPIKHLKAVATCFGSCRNHHQGATTSALLNLQSCPTMCVGEEIVSVMATYLTIIEGSI
jgi:hypothetical protein